MHRTLPTLLLLLGCNDQKVTSIVTPPVVSIQSPADGAAVDEAVPILLKGKVEDDKFADSLDQLAPTWSLDGQPICEGSTVDAGGTIECTHVFEASGEATLSLVVANPDGASAQSDVSLTISPNSPPEIDLVQPTSAGRYYSDQETPLQAVVADAEDPASQLTVAWSSDVDGDLAVDAVPSDDGAVSGGAVLSSGPHTLTATVTDSTGLSASRTVDVTVGGPNLLPACEILYPAMYDVFAEGEALTFAGTASDPDVASTLLTAEWTSDKDGSLGVQAPTSSGELYLAAEDLSLATHTITLAVRDENAALCTDSVVITVGAPPEITIDLPFNGDLFNEGDTVGFQATVSDDADAATDLEITWESDLDGVFSVQGADSSGIAEVGVDALSPGEHVITATAADTGGLSASDLITLTINGVPSAPGVSITPASPSAEDGLLAAVTAPSVDEEGDPVTYAYAWSLDGVPSGYTAASVPASATARGDTWTVAVTPSDGYGSGPAGAATVVIGNAAPSLSSAVLTPESPSEADTLTCAPGSASDIDGDTVTFTYAWTVNGSTISPTTSTLTGAWFANGDSVACVVTPTDGADTGSPVTSNAVTVGNSAPSVASAAVSPNPAYEESALSCLPSGASDPDGDVVSYEYAWIVEGSLISPTTSTLDGAWFDRGDGVACALTPTDGLESGATVTSSPVVISNTAPSIAGVSLTPTPAFEKTTLTCAPSGASDPDGDPITYLYAWTVNGAALTHANATIDGSWFSRDDSVACAATPNDGAVLGTSASSSPVIIENSSPGTPVIEIQPTDAEPEDDLTCAVLTGSVDPDGDAVTYTYRWLKNGADSGITDSAVDAYYTDLGDTWQCIVTPTDGDAAGATGIDSQSILDRTAPDVPTIDAIAEYRNETSVSLSGTAEAGSTVTVYVDCDSAMYTSMTDADAGGEWAVTVPITQGDTCSYYADAQDDLGNISDYSNTVQTESCDPFDDYEDESGAGDTCSGAVDAWGVLNDSGTLSISFTGNILDAADEDWYAIDTSQSVTTSGINVFRLKVTMSAGSDDYGFTIWRGSCLTSAIECDSGGAEGEGYSEYEMYARDVGDHGHLVPSDTRYCSNSSPSYNRCDDLSGTYYVHVFRKEESYDCAPYTIQVTNGVW